LIRHPAGTYDRLILLAECDVRDAVPLPHEGTPVRKPLRTIDWLQLIKSEYLEMPGLHLTKPQARRLWGLDDATCDALLETLEKDAFLRRSAANGYIRADLAR
jgi:hypothetical protein